MIFLVFGLVSSVFQSIERKKEIDREIESKKSEVVRLKAEQAKLQEELVRVQSEEYIEGQLRDNLGYQKEGEIVLVLPEPEIVKKLAPKLYPEEPQLPESNWEKWLDLFI